MMQSFMEVEVTQVPVFLQNPDFKVEKCSRNFADEVGTMSRTSLIN